MKWIATKKECNFFTLAVFLLLLNNSMAFSQNEDRGHVEVYISSQEGDRLSRKRDAQFIQDANSSLPVITVDEKDLARLLMKRVWFV